MCSPSWTVIQATCNFVPGSAGVIVFVRGTGRRTRGASADRGPPAAYARTIGTCVRTHDDRQIRPCARVDQPRAGHGATGRAQGRDPPVRRRRRARRHDRRQARRRARAPARRAAARRQEPCPVGVDQGRRRHDGPRRPRQGRRQPHGHAPHPCAVRARRGRRDRRPRRRLRPARHRQGQGPAAGARRHHHQPAARGGLPLLARPREPAAVHGAPRVGARPATGAARTGRRKGPAGETRRVGRRDHRRPARTS